MNIASEDYFLGDGLYARIADGMIVLLTQRTSGVHFVCLEPETFAALVNWADDNEFGAPR